MMGEPCNELRETYNDLMLRLVYLWDKEATTWRLDIHEWIGCSYEDYMDWVHDPEYIVKVNNDQG